MTYDPVTGNVYALLRERKPKQEAIDKGFDMNNFYLQNYGNGNNNGTMDDSYWYPDFVAEYTANFDDKSFEKVWEWHPWYNTTDTTQNRPEPYDPESDFRIDINDSNPTISTPDIWHMNGIDYNWKRKQLVLGGLGASQMWVFDRVTETLVMKYKHEVSTNYTHPDLHDTRWSDTSSSKSDLMYFDNKVPTSSVCFVEYGNKANMTRSNNLKNEISLPQNVGSAYISSAHLTENGNIVTCTGALGQVHELTPSGEVVYKFVNPIKRSNEVVTNHVSLAFQDNRMFKVEKYPATCSLFLGLTADLEISDINTSHNVGVNDGDLY